MWLELDSDYFSCFLLVRSIVLLKCFILFRNTNEAILLCEGNSNTSDFISLLIIIFFG